MYYNYSYNRKRGKVVNVSKTARALAAKHEIDLSQISPNEHGNITIAMVKSLIKQ